MTETEKSFNKLWDQTHLDFKGRTSSGTKAIMSWAKYGHGLVTAKTIFTGLIERLRE